MKFASETYSFGQFFVKLFNWPCFLYNFFNLEVPLIVKFKPEPDKPESPNFKSETRWARAQSLQKFASPIKPEPEGWLEGKARARRFLGPTQH